MIKFIEYRYSGLSLPAVTTGSMIRCVTKNQQILKDECTITKVIRYLVQAELHLSPNTNTPIYYTLFPECRTDRMECCLRTCFRSGYPTDYLVATPVELVIEFERVFLFTAGVFCRFDVRDVNMLSGVSKSTRFFVVFTAGVLSCCGVFIESSVKDWCSPVLVVEGFTANELLVLLPTSEAGLSMAIWKRAVFLVCYQTLVIQIS